MTERSRIGIDLGTTNSVLASVINGKVEVYRDEFGSTTLPSIVAQTHSGENLVGRRARLYKDPAFRHAFFKRALGSKQPFPLKDGTVDAWQLSSHVLGYLKGLAETWLGGPVEAVITVPAHFHEVQRAETRMAAEAAGLAVCDVIPEPVAAAIAYFHEDAPSGDDSLREYRICVYDFGGGTFDASVCSRQGEHVEVAASGRAFDGNKFLGGVDLDKALIRLAADRLPPGAIEVTIGHDLPRLAWLWKLMQSAEHCKHELSKEPEFQWQFAAGTEDDAHRDFEFWIQRSQFEEAIQPELKKTCDLTDAALLTYWAARANEADRILDRETRLRAAAQTIDRVLLVGGSTLVPAVRATVERHFAELCGRPMDVRFFRPFECVAIGAAIYADAQRGAAALTPGGHVTWVTAPAARVGGSVNAHPALEGRIEIPAGSAGAVVEVRAGSQVQQVKVAADGRFRVPSFALEQGENQVEVTLLDASGHPIWSERRVVVRGGISISAPGLARGIEIRLVEGIVPFIPAGTRAEEQIRRTFYVNRSEPMARLPLFEGHAPTAILDFPADAEPGTAVVIGAQYTGGRLEVEIRLGQRAPIRREVQLLPVVYASEVADLQRAFIECSRKAEYVLKDLPTHGHHAESLRREFQALKLDIETEFVRPTKDLARIADRLDQLDRLCIHVAAFAKTPEGLRLRVREARALFSTAKDTGDLLNELDRIEKSISDREGTEGLAALDAQVSATEHSFILRNPPNLSPQMLAGVVDEIRGRLESVQRDSGGDPALIKKVQEVAETLNGIMLGPFDDRERLKRLFVCDNQHVRPLYREVVIRRGESGLLRQSLN